MEHHVYFWLKDERKNPTDEAAFGKGLAALFAINTVAGGSWGPPAETPPRPVIENSWSYGLSMKFTSIEDHNIYQEDPAHDAFVAEFKDWWEKVQVMDLA